MKLGGLQFAVADRVDSIAFSPDSATVAVAVSKGSSATAPKEVLLFDASTGRERHDPLPARESRPLMFSRDGERLRCGATVWDKLYNDPSPLATDTHVAAISADERWAVLFSDKAWKTMTVWNLRDSVATMTADCPGLKSRFALAAISSDGATFAISTIHRVLQLRAFSNGKVLHELKLPDTQGTGSLAFSPDGKQLANGDAAGSVVIFDVVTGELKQTCRRQQGFQLSVVRYTPDGKSLVAASATSGQIAIWDPASGEPTEGFSTNGLTTAQDIAFSPDGRYLAVGGTSQRSAERDRPFAAVYSNAAWTHEDSTLRVFDWNTRRELFPTLSSPSPIINLAFSPDSTQVAIGTADEQIAIWDVAAGKPIVQFKGDSSGHLAFSSDGWVLGAAARKGAYHLWAADTGADLVQLPIQQGSSILPFVTHCSFSSDMSEILMGGQDGKIREITLSSGKVKLAFPAYARGDVTALAYSHDGTLIATAGGLGTAPQGDASANRESIQLFKASSGEPLKDLVSTLIKDPPMAVTPGPGAEAPARFFAVSFSPDDALVAATNSVGTCVWDVESGKQFYVLAGHAGYFSSDGSMLIYADGDMIRAVELASGQICWDRTIAPALDKRTAERRATPAQSFDLPPLAVAPDGRSIVTALDGESTASVCSLVPVEMQVTHPTPLTEREKELLWTKLADLDSRAAYVAMWRLVADCDPTVDYIRLRFKAPRDDAEELKKTAMLIARLDDDLYRTREEASKSLKELGGNAEVALRQALHDPALSLEARLRVEHILESIDSHIQRRGGEPLRRIRIVSVLGQIDSRKAVDFLKELASGPSAARETHDAKAALARRQALHKGR